MPELPEVELARRGLAAWLEGAKIVRATVSDARVFDSKREAARASELVGRRVVTVDRRGKWLRFALSRGRVFSHLGMTGKWLLAAEDAPLRFEKLRLDVQSAREVKSVRYLDARVFGRVVLTDDAEDIPAWRDLGPDPLTDGIDLARFGERLHARKIPIKAALLDQGILAGVGNIQATEALFFAGIDPRRAASTLSRLEVQALARAIRRSIRRTLAGHDSPIARYVSEGEDNPFVVYGRGGDPCPRCRARLSKVTLAGRGTVFCGRCQG